jgi:beta-aspartyl-peptidase (threonine type)
MTKAKPAVIVHGGAGPIRDDSLPQRLEGCKAATLAAWKILEHSGSALDAAEAAVVVLEDHPLFNAGTGSTLNRLGRVEMDAGIMDGASLRAGGVAAIEGIKNPIKLARRVLEDGRHVILAAEGALMFAREIGFPECSSESLIVEHERKRWSEKHGTVGCVALDCSGKVAVTTSTGGVFNKLPGRIGDSPLPGCGTYADDRGGVSCTGLGEAIIRVVLAKTAVDFLSEGIDPNAAARKSLSLLEEKTGAQAGLIMIDCQGRIGYARNTTHMPVCFIKDVGSIAVDS